MARSVETVVVGAGQAGLVMSRLLSEARREHGRVTDIEGLTFIGLPWMVDMGSANLIGLVRDAEALAARW